MRGYRVSAICTAILAGALSGCGNSDDPIPLADSSGAAAAAPTAGPTPFIAGVAVSGRNLDKVSSVGFVIDPAPGTYSKAVSVTYAASYLARRGLVQADALRVPVFGLYAGAQNTVSMTLTFIDDSTITLPLTVTTAAYTDPIYSAPQAVVPRAADLALGYDFIYMKSLNGSPVIVDTDGRTRWVATGVTGTASSTFSDGAFILGSPEAPTLTRLELDGTSTPSGTLDTPEVTIFHHDMEPGKTGLIDNVNLAVDGVEFLLSTAQEILPTGHVIAQWDLDRILSDYMLANGDDPTLFVRTGIDWFHMNTAIYDAADDSVILSGREDFVIKLDYLTGAIKWIFGDPTKYWYTFPSLRAKSLTLLGGGLVPIGQHSITIAPDGNLLLFNNGFASLNQPAGAPLGETRGYSAVSSYALDETAMTATETWNFDYGQQIYSPICSSVQQMEDGSLLIDYASAEGQTTARIVGLDGPAHRIAFDYRYPNRGCNTAWNSQPFPLDALLLE